MYKKVIIIVAFILISLSFKLPQAFATGGMNGYMTNLLTSIQSLSPTAYQGQQRGFLVGGSMEIPPQGENIQPLSATLPHLSFNGCGGIDLTMGGFSYLNFQYLVQKLQGILQAAPSFAFEIALKILSEQASGVMNDLEAATNAINGLNLNSCSAMNKIVSAITPTASQIKNVQAKQASSNQQATGGSSWFGSALTSVVSNVQSSWGNFVNSFSNSSSSSNQTNPLISFGLPGSSPSMLHLAEGNITTGFPNLVPTLRYFVADVTPVTPPAGSKVKAMTAYIPPCGNFSFKLYSGIAKAIVEEGNLPEATMNTSSPSSFCSGATVNSFTPLEQTVETDIQDIYSSMQSGANLTNPTEINLINVSPIPIYSFLRLAYLTNDPGLVNYFSTSLAKTISYGIVYQLINQVTGLVVEGVNDNEIQLDAGSSTVAPTKAATKQLIKQLDTFAEAAGQEYLIHLQKVKAIYGSFMQQYQQDSQVVQSDLKKQGKLASYHFEQTAQQGY